jgi:hypothetical protein
MKLHRYFYDGVLFPDVQDECSPDDATARCSDEQEQDCLALGPGGRYVCLNRECNTFFCKQLLAG